MNLAPDTNKRVEELQLLESHLQTFLAQKQTIQIEINEVDNALEELGTSGEEVYKMTSGFMMKLPKERVKKELEEKKDLLQMRVASMEKQEKLIENDAKKLRDEIQKIISDSSKNVK